MSDQVGNPEDRFSHNEAHIALRPVTPSGVSTALARCSLIFRNTVRSQEIPDAFLEKAPATASSQ